MIRPDAADESPDPLGQPLTLPCGATLRNRLAKASMSEQLAGAGAAPGESHVRLYRRWGRSGAGLLLTGNVMVDARHLAEPGNVSIEDRRHLEILKRWAAAAHEGSSDLWMQINHPGRQCPKTLDRAPVAPSAIAVRGGGQFAVPRALADAEVREIIERFATTAAVAKESGFAGVEIHGAHGYLVSQFLSARTNRRDDAWGGDAARRRRFLIEVLRAVRGAVGARFPVGLKLNSADFQRGGFTEEESMAVLGLLDQERVDLVEISGGTYEAPSMMVDNRVAESTKKREAYFLEYAEKARRHTKVPIMVTGGFRTAAGMAHAITESKIQVIGMARPLALEPDLPRRILAGEAAGSSARRRQVGIRALDGLAENQYYLQQLWRMAEGRDPDPDRGTLRSLAIGLYRQLTGSRPARISGGDAKG
jgi:2,4-dienoyl-CoA reductase-like NADH-dependent reductase (Old Yellow Enzyme family)